MRNFVCALICGALLTWDAASATEVWFSPNDNLRRGAAHDIVLNEDFPHLFDDNPSWSAGADVFVISAIMANGGGSEDELRRIAAFLERRHIKLAVGVHATETANAKPVAGECGAAVEGAIRAGQNEAIFKRAKRLGLDIAYFEMDEPLTFGHYFKGKAGCRNSVAETARRAAAEIAEIRKSYPQARIVDAEAPQAIPTAQWRRDFEEWLDVYHKAAGAPLDAVVFDVDLFGDWRERVAVGVEIAKRHGVRAGIFVFKPGPGVSDAQAAADYKRAIAEVDASKIPFDIVEIANWSLHPFANLPQSDPTTMTYLLDFYNRTHGRE
ncbi:MAG: hypothetical protein KGM15_16030 [Pseudomonadota bacterium]|nr:hypothetical protein [Pseudomonadota bacterium]